MTWRPAPTVRASVAAVVLAVLAVAQAAAGGNAAVSGAVGTGPAVSTVERPQDVLVAVLLALATTAPVALAGTWPVVAAMLIAAATLLGLGAQVPPTVGGLLALGTVYAVVGLRHRVRTVLVLVAPFVAALALPVENVSATVVVLGVALLAGVGGIAWRVRDEGRRRDAVVEAAHESTLEHLARGERARIARELHDVVAHHVSLIALQAEAARLTVPGMPPEGEKRLLAIGATARTALAEMRRLLGVLREDADGADVVTRRPQPGLAQLTELLDEVRDAGPGGARLLVRGKVAPLDQSIEVTAYRIVQEALTNARRHAPGAAVDVELDYRPDRLVVRIRDNGPGPAAIDGDVGHGVGHGDPGHGLAGMRERAAMAGGTVRTGAGSLGGFLVSAELPVPGSP
ncbi:sensor histidine kinase [Cellulomonas humilata]|uniref:sensor histidine kinase n=1 Tax=Cellulomonas humilata TaxID=144055 RepID=UPI001B3562A7|nr:sensor histidine kinase [Cellulomonas humilata]